MIWAVLLSAAVAAVGSSTAESNGKGWSEYDAARRYGIQKPTPVKFSYDKIDQFLLGIMDKFKDMPLPDDPKFELVRDKNKQILACEIPDSDEDSMEVSPNPDDVMDTVVRVFADGKCAGRRFGEWYYQVCGNMAVKRSPCKVSYTEGKPKVTTFKAHESLGVLGRDRKVSRHLASVSEPRHVEQTYYDGSKCNVGGDSRRMQTTVRFECSRRFKSGYVHINEAIEEHPCKYRLLLLSADFCDNDWLRGRDDHNNIVKCRIYFHPERIKPLMKFLAKFKKEAAAKAQRKRAFMEYHADEENDRMLQNYRFERDDGYGLPAEHQRMRRLLDYVMTELIWASMNPDIPYTEDEQRAREAEEKWGQKDDHRRLINLKNALEKRRTELMSELDGPEGKNERDWYEFASYTEMMRMIGIDSLQNVYANFYASWLDHMVNNKQEDEWFLGSPLLIAPNRKPFPIDAFMLLEGLIKSTYARSVRKVYKALLEEKELDTEQLNYEDDLDENDLAKMTERFMQMYKESKKGGDRMMTTSNID